MKYDKQKFNESKQAYEGADNLSNWMKNAKENVSSAEGLAWCVCGLVAFVALCFLGYGKAGDGWAFLEALTISVIPLAPAIAFSVVRRITRGILNRVVASKYKTGQYYIKYENQIYDVKTRWGKALDRLADIANSDSKNVTNDLISVAKNMEKVSEELDKEYDLSPEQEQEVIKSVTKSAEYNINKIKKLSEAQKKQFMQEFKESLYDR